MAWSRIAVRWSVMSRAAVARTTASAAPIPVSRSRSWRLTSNSLVPLMPLISSTMSAVPNGEPYQRLLRVARMVARAAIAIAASKDLARLTLHDEGGEEHSDEGRGEALDGTGAVDVGGWSHDEHGSGGDPSVVGDVQEVAEGEPDRCCGCEAGGVHLCEEACRRGRNRRSESGRGDGCVVAEHEADDDRPDRTGDEDAGECDTRGRGFVHAEGERWDEHGGGEAGDRRAT